MVQRSVFAWLFETEVNVMCEALGIKYCARAHQEESELLPCSQLHGNSSQEFSRIFVF